jgi:hypothetical protein
MSSQIFSSHQVDRRTVCETCTRLGWPPERRTFMHWQSLFPVATRGIFRRNRANTGLWVSINYWLDYAIEFRSSPDAGFLRLPFRTPWTWRDPPDKLLFRKDLSKAREALPTYSEANLHEIRAPALEAHASLWFVPWKPTKLEETRRIICGGWTSIPEEFFSSTWRDKETSTMVESWVCRPYLLPRLQDSAA